MTEPCRITVDNRVRLLVSSLSEDARAAIQDAFTHPNPDQDDADGPRFYRTHRVEAGELSAPRGGMSRVRDILKANAIVYQVDDARCSGDFAELDDDWDGEWPAHEIVLREWQGVAKDDIIAMQNCILRAPTGSGKSVAGLVTICDLKIPTIVVVPTTGLVEQWVELIHAALKVPLKRIGQIGDGKHRTAPITVATQAALAVGVRPQWARAFGAVMFDECFIGSSQILMMDGTCRSIDSIHEGDVVAVGGAVRSVMHRPFVGAMHAIGDAWATPDHPVATTDGWKNASEIGGADDLWYDPLHAKRSVVQVVREEAVCEQSTRHLQGSRVRYVRFVDGQMHEVREDRLEELQGSARRQQVRHREGMERRIDSGGYSQIAFQTQGHFQARDVCQDEKGLARSGISRTAFQGSVLGAASAVSENGRTRTKSSENVAPDQEWEDLTLWRARTWQWQAAYAGREGDAASLAAPRLRTGHRPYSRFQAARIAQSLQSGFVESRANGSGGDRWRVASGNGAIGGGRAQDFLPRVHEVEGVSLPGAVRLCRGSAHDTRMVRHDGVVWNIETENGVYVAGGVLVHNCHRAAAPTIFAAVDPWPAKYRIGMSASEKRHDKKEFLVHDLFGKVAADILEEDVLAAGHTVEVDLVFIPTGFQAEWYRAAVRGGNMFHIRAAHKKLLDIMPADKKRNRLILDTVIQEVKRDNQVMVLSLRREHCLAIDADLAAHGIPAGIMLGGQKSKHEFKRTKEMIRSGDFRVVTGTTEAIGTGQDFPSVSVGFVTMPIYNNKQLMNQVKGRFCRSCEEIGKTRGTLYCLWDKDVFGKKPLENATKWFKSVAVLEAGVLHDAADYLGKMKQAGRQSFTGKTVDRQMTLDDLVTRR